MFELCLVQIITWQLTYLSSVKTSRSPERRVVKCFELCGGDVFLITWWLCGGEVFLITWWCVLIIINLYSIYEKRKSLWGSEAVKTICLLIMSCLNVNSSKTLKTPKGQKDPEHRKVTKYPKRPCRPRRPKSPQRPWSPEDPKVWKDSEDPLDLNTI